MKRVAAQWALLLSAAAPCGPAAADIYVHDADNESLVLSDVAEDARYRLFIDDVSVVLPASPNRARNRRDFGVLIEDAAASARLDSALVHAVIAVESAGNPQALSPKGAGGLMQLMPATARRYGVRDVFDPAQNIRGGTQYLGDLLSLFGQDINLALAAYNAGEDAVVRWGRAVPPFRETRNYVHRVTGIYRQLRAESEGR